MKQMYKKYLIKIQMGINSINGGLYAIGMSRSKSCYTDTKAEDEIPSDKF